MIGIYCITNLVNGKKYIGQSLNIEKRWKDHKSNYLNCKNSSLYAAIRKYGINNFKFEILEECDAKELNSKEIYWISFYQTYPPELNKGYNLTPGGEGQAVLKKLNNNALNNIVEDLKNNILTQDQIAKKYSIDQAIVSNINSGREYKSYLDTNLKFPIRKNYCYNNCKTKKNVYSLKSLSDILTDEKINEIIKDLNNYKITQDEIANKNKVSKNIVIKINKGEIKSKNNIIIDYPIRNRSKVLSEVKKGITPPSYKELLKLFYELRSASKVAEKYGISQMLLKKWCRNYGINPQNKKVYIERYEVEFLGKEPKIKNKYNDIVIQLDMETKKFIAEYKSKNIAGKSVGGTGVGLANAIKKGKPYKGFLWKEK